MATRPSRGSADMSNLLSLGLRDWAWFDYLRMSGRLQPDPSSLPGAGRHSGTRQDQAHGVTWTRALVAADLAHGMPPFRQPAVGAGTHLRSWVIDAPERIVAAWEQFRTPTT